MNENTIYKLKESIDNYKGTRIVLKTRKGKKKVQIDEGVLTEVYPSIFTVIVDNKRGFNRAMSYSYIDVLTNTVEVYRYNDNVETRIRLVE